MQSLMIPPQVYLEHWFNPYSQSELNELLQRR